MSVQSIKQILESSPFISSYKGSEKTREMVEEQIRKRYGDSEVKNYNPYKNTLTFSQWVHLSYRPKKGSKALKSITYIDRKDSKGKIIGKFAQKINLFYWKDVEPIPKLNSHD